MLTFSSTSSIQVCPDACYGSFGTKPDECYSSPGTNLKHAMVHLELQDGLTEVPKHVFWPQNGLEHQAGVRGLEKVRRKSLVTCCCTYPWAGFQRSRLSRTQKPRDEMAQVSWAAAIASPDSFTNGGGVT